MFGTCGALWLVEWYVALVSDFVGDVCLFGKVLIEVLLCIDWDLSEVMVVLCGGFL